MSIWIFLALVCFGLGIWISNKYEDSADEGKRQQSHKVGTYLFIAAALLLAIGGLGESGPSYEGSFSGAPTGR